MTSRTAPGWGRGRGPGRGRSAAAAVAVGLAAAWVLLAPAEGVQAARADRPAGTVDRVMRDHRLTEASGLAVDPYRGDVIWTLNDSGNRPDLFALAKDGSTRTRVTVKGVDNVDWEALQSWRAPGGQGLIVVADIGDNRDGRTSVRLIAVPVGPSSGRFSTSPAAVITLEYPDVPHNAEALLLDPRDGHLYVVTKGLFTGTLYAVPPTLWTPRAWRPGQSMVRRKGTLVKVVDIPMNLVTDGAVLPDGRIVLRNYGEVDVFGPVASLGDGMADKEAEADLPEQEQGEGLTVVAGAGGHAELLIGSEGEDRRLLRVPLPGRPAPAPVSGPARVPASSAAAEAQGRSAAQVAEPEEGRSWSTPLLVVALAAGGYWYVKVRKK